jgi:preprotein translocase subunit SecA
MHQTRRTDQNLLSEIRKRAAQIEGCDSNKLLDYTQDLRIQVQSGGLPILSTHAVTEAFALATEALRRTSGKIYYDVQLLGGLVLSTGAIAEMQTGEGKTVTCGLPAILYGLTGKGVHVATTNAYLAERDHEELTPVFDALGLSSGILNSDQDVHEKKNVYLKDVTYGTGYEFGFDFLRDQMALRNKPHLPLGTRFLSRLRGMKSQELTLMQRPLAYAIIDEADSVLIDEATTPLILSGNSNKTIPDPDVYHHAMQVADDLTDPNDFETDWTKKSLELTDEGWKRAHADLPANIQQRLKRPWSEYVDQALRARVLFSRDTDYVVQEDQVIIIDQNTGRLHDERKWRNGLHQAVEMREGVTLTEEREIEARITRQRYFAFYQQVSGMTGTAGGNEAELLEFYDLPVVKIQRNKPSRRETVQARYFGNEQNKFEAIALDIVKRSSQNQPVLVGTKTITQSLQIAELLNRIDQPHVVLNGVQDNDESSIISKAGRTGAVTIATNMAGRGTDIKLDDAARAAGGLHVIVAEHHESPRVDRQLIGRSARQSDPGSCQFFVAAEDEIIRRYDPAFSKAIKKSADPTTGECRHNFDTRIRDLQERIEKMGFASRKKMVIHDRWMETVQKSVARLA